MFLDYEKLASASAPVAGWRSIVAASHSWRQMAMADLVAAAMPSDRSLLIVEDDKSFLQRLARAMESRGFAVTTAESVADGLTSSKGLARLCRRGHAARATATVST